MTKRLFFVVIVVAAFLVLAVPAFAWNGYRADFTLSSYCAICHSDGSPGGAPHVYDQWAETKHANSNGIGQATRPPTGTSCAGCHTSNYDPTKASPSPSATTYVYNNDPGTTTPDQDTGNAPSSELDVGCSACHYGTDTGALPQYGDDPNSTAHMSKYADLANAEICGQCHSHYSYTTDTYTLIPTPTPDAATPLLQPQYAIGYPMLGTPAPSPSSGWGDVPALSDYLNIPSPGWTPTPNPDATTAAGLMTYWQLDGQDLMWQSAGHDGSAAQYSEWANEPHANSLADLRAAFGPGPTWPSFLNACLKCHSADYRIADASSKPDINTAKYGITCVGCHDPHDKGTAKGAWDEGFDTQLTTDNAKTLCVQCHTAEIGTGAATPGATIHNATKEVMNGTGGIGVAQGTVGVHKGKCVQCHMPPTSYSRGSVQLGGNHTFTIIEPDVAASVTPIPVATTTPTPSGSPVVEMGVMPYSACSTCHSRSGDQDATWLQDTLDQRQEAMHSKYDNVTAALVAAGGRMHYVAPGSVSGDEEYITWLNGVLNDKGKANWSSDELNWQKAYTNWTYVAAEGSWGIHNWQYDNVVIDAALNQANSVDTAPQKVTFKANHRTVRLKATVKFTGTVRPKSSGTITIQRKVKGHWKKWKTTKVNSSGNLKRYVKMTRKGTFYLRAFFPASPPYAGGVSRNIKVVVK
jgi:hypothetical protein